MLTGTGRDVLPLKQKAHELGGSDRLDFLAQPADRQPMDPRQEPAVTPLDG
jgi:hypothetical protein